MKKIYKNYMVIIPKELLLTRTLSTILNDYSNPLKIRINYASNNF